jgi:hypothetical protein
VVDADYVSTPGFSFSFDGTSGEFDLRRRTEEQAGTACLPLSKASRLTLWRCDAAQSVLDSGSNFGAICTRLILNALGKSRGVSEVTKRSESF